MGWKEFLFGSTYAQPYHYEPDRNKNVEDIKKEDEIKVKPTETIYVKDCKEKTPVVSDENKTSVKDDKKFETRRINRIEDKDAIVLVIENSIWTREFKNQILQLAKKIIDSNQDCFFLLMRMGDDKKILDVVDYETLEQISPLSDWFTEGSTSDCDYLGILNTLEEFYKSSISFFEYFDTTQQIDKKYLIQDINIVFFGSGNINLDKETKKKCIESLKYLKSRMKIKSIKYFCTLDKQTINPANLGFPVIGHIETDFYK